MEKSLILAALCVEFIVLDTVHCFPIDISSVGEGGSNPLWLTNYFVTGIGFFLISVIILIGCLCCRNGKGFKQNEGKVIQEFSNSSGNLTASRFDGFVNPTLNSELTIFPPLGASCNEICRFEPLPDIKYQTQNLRPAAFSYTEQEISSQDWFLDPYRNFPRNQLKYVQEYGRGWFGRVVEGEAQNITPNEKITKVMVKILHEDATPTDHMYFLHEVKFYRDLKHSNILRLLGQCLEMEPFLIILECYPNGDLKSFLSQNLASAQALVQQGVTLKMCSNITSGLQFMHDKKFIHTDLAARNCLVGPDLTIKIGDYGNSIEVFKADYYCTGSVALPVRWCAPETLKCTDITIETREVTPPANIWSLGVVLWEICEFCKLPYAELNDDEVIVRVLGEKNYFLEKPNMFCLHKDELYHLMKLCWKPPLQRPSASQICIILNNLISSGKTHKNEVQLDSNRISQDFEQRWRNFKPNSIPKKDEPDEVNRDASADCSIISLKLKNAKVVDLSYVDSPLGIFLTNKTSDQDLPRICLKNEKKSAQEIKRKPATEVNDYDGEKNIFECNNYDDAFDNCHSKAGEAESNTSTESKILNSDEKLEEKQPEVDSWLKGVEINNEEDESFVRKISEAIRDLDATLALEKTSSSEENSGKSTRQNSPGKDLKEANEITVDFKLGQDTSSFRNFTKKAFELSSLQNTEQPQSLNFTNAYIEKNKQSNQDFDSASLIVPFIEVNKCKSDILDESLKENDSLLCGQSRNSSDTDDEIWRRRIEKGEISEKVKEKSKSIANLMILTHIDSDDSDIDFEKPSDRGFNRSSLNRRSGSFAKASLLSNNFGSENDLTFAVLEDDFKKSLKKLSDHHKEHGHFDSLGVILPLHANRENIWENLFKSPKSDEKIIKNSKTDSEEVSREVFSEKEFQQTLKNENNFLANAASEELDINIIVEEEGDENSVPLKERLLKNMAKESTVEDFDKNVSVEMHSKCDNKTYKTDCTPLLQNSSHLKESDVDSHTSLCITSKEDSILKNNGKESVCASLKENVGEFETFNGDSLTENDLLKFSQCNKEESFTPISKNNPFLNFENESQETQDLKDVVNLNFKLISGDTISKCYGQESEFENKNSIIPLIPQITITEEPEEKYIENSEDMFTTEISDPKSSNFDLKGIENPTFFEVNQLEQDFINMKTTPISDTFFAKSTENEHKKFFAEENPTVVVGACEDFTMDYFKGLKTTSEDINVANKHIKNDVEDLGNKEENLDVWDKHLEKALTQQLNNTNFDDISFRNLCLDSAEITEANQHNVNNNFSTSECSIEVLTDFIESERFHTEKLEESIHINRFTNLSVLSSEEEYEHFKLRTPDDERSSDSGFRDKGSLSESVEDACEGKYNLEDIEAELEEAFVKGVFTNFETDREKEINKNSKAYNNFEYEESKFYEDENRNEEDFSDIDGEIEFWQNKDESDYYPQISEFSPNCSQGWYLHPPDENVLICNRSINEDIVKALRNELQESLPIQNRSFDEFNDFYEKEIEDSNKDVNIHFISELSFPLSPILEEQDSSGYNSRKNAKNFLLEGNGTTKVKKNVMKLIENAKAIDTDTFMQYLDYMVENEGRDFNEIEKVIKNSNGPKENFNSPELVLHAQSNDFDRDDKRHSLRTNFQSRNENSILDRKQKVETIVLEENSKFSENKSEDDVLVINLNTNEAILLEEGKFKSHPSFDCTEEQKDDYLDMTSDNSENDGLIFTPEILSPDRERSFSEISRSSNGTRTGDALSEITLSSPDLVPDCFSTLNQETVPQIAPKEVIREPLQEDALNVDEDSVSSALSLQFSNNESAKTCEPLSDLEASTCFYEKEKNDISIGLESLFHKSNTKESELAKSKGPHYLENELNSKDSYEMSTSFIGEDDGEDADDDDDNDNDTEEIYSNYNTQSEQEQEQSQCHKTPEDLVLEDSNTVDWQSESSGDEELSSSSEEFIWKDGNKESKIKASHASDFAIDKALYEKAQNNQRPEKMLPNETQYHNSNIKEKETIEAETLGSDDDDNESSTGSSASFTDFVPSAWNSLATPTRSVLKNPDNRMDKQKKNVWFKKQKYHCVYEYPREPSDSEEADSSPCNQPSYEKTHSEASIKHFNYGVNTVKSPNKHFPYGISKLIDLSAYTDWEVVEGEDVDLSLTDTDSDNGSGKSDADVTKNVDSSFYNLSPFDYDFNIMDMPEGESEFFVSSSSRPFQGGSSNFSPGLNAESKTIRIEAVDSKDFVTPDSGVEDCTNEVSPVDKIGSTQDNTYSETENLTTPNKGVMNLLDSLNFSFLDETKENSSKETDINSFEDSAKGKNGYSITNGSILLPKNGLGQLKHTRDKLKLDLSHNHNAELGSVMKVRKE